MHGGTQECDDVMVKLKNSKSSFSMYFPEKKKKNPQDFPFKRWVEDML